MKKIWVLLLVIVISAQAKSQTTAEQMSSRIASRMKDSLNLTETQREQIYAINMQIASQKQGAREASTDREKIGKQLQQIENTRDGLYAPVLGEEKYLLYRKKKDELLNKQ